MQTTHKNTLKFTQNPFQQKRKIKKEQKGSKIMQQVSKPGEKKKKK